LLGVLDLVEEIEDVSLTRMGGNVGTRNVRFDDFICNLTVSLHELGSHGVELGLLFIKFLFNLSKTFLTLSYLR